MARLIKVGPAVLVISAVVAFMLIYIPNAIRILIVMAIAGMITPVVIASVLSLYYKISGRSSYCFHKGWEDIATWSFFLYVNISF